MDVSTHGMSLLFVEHSFVNETNTGGLEWWLAQGCIFLGPGHGLSLLFCTVNHLLVPPVIWFGSCVNTPQSKWYVLLECGHSRTTLTGFGTHATLLLPNTDNFTHKMWTLLA